MLFLVSVYFVALFLIEAVFGSSIGIYNAEIGYEATCEAAAKMPAADFFLRMAPVIGGFALLVFVLMQVLT